MIITQEKENKLIEDLWVKLSPTLQDWKKENLKSTDIGFICFDFYRSALVAQQLFYKINNELGFKESVCQLAYMGVPKPWETKEVKEAHSKLLELVAPSLKQTYKRLIIFKLECLKEECLDWVEESLTKAKIEKENYLTCGIIKSSDCPYDLPHYALEIDPEKESYDFYWNKA